MEKQYIDYMLDKLAWLLSIPSPSGFTDQISVAVAAELEAMSFSTCRSVKGTVSACLGGQGDPLALAAHVDTLGGMVRSIKKSGRLRIEKIGDLNMNSLESENCTVHTRDGRTYTGTFQVLHPSSHVYKDNLSMKRSKSKMEVVLDEMVNSAEQTQALGISSGDFVSFEPRLVVTPSGFIKSRFLDNKAGVAVLLGLARMIADGKINPRRKLVAVFPTYEEVGHAGCGGACADTQEILAIDMGCVGGDLNGEETKVSISAADSSGPYDYTVTTNLIRLAQQHKLDYAVDVYPYYESDSSMSACAGHEVQHGLIGPGVFASHAYERTHIEGLKNTLKLLSAYVTQQ